MNGQLERPRPGRVFKNTECGWFPVPAPLVHLQGQAGCLGVHLPTEHTRLAALTASWLPPPNSLPSPPPSSPVLATSQLSIHPSVRLRSLSIHPSVHLSIH